ncbi:hypothetical protein ABPG75_009372 [Micractinium tetrahymenae]
MRSSRSGSQPLLQTSRGRREPGSPRRKHWRALGALLLALLAVVAVVAGGSALVLRPLADDDVAAADGASGTPAEPWTVAGLEAAYSAMASSGDPSAALAGSESLAAARQRALKAAALPPPEFRSHAGGVSLSPGAADVAARCAGARCARVRRFVLAAAEVGRLVESGGCAVQHCPDALGVGRRPLPYTPHAFGNRCEPLWNRGALEAVRQLIAPGWRVLEWHTGGSTAWFLARLAELTSIEGAPGFANKTASVAAAQFEPAFLESHWQLHVAPPRRRVLTFGDTEAEEVWEEYCSARVLPAGAVFDVVAVQGFARMACLRRAVALLRPQGGLLVLPQAQRPAYAAAAELVPAHWLRLSDSHALGTTLVWMSIRSPGEAAAAGEDGLGGGSSSGSTGRDPGWAGSADVGAVIAQE